MAHCELPLMNYSILKFSTHAQRTNTTENTKSGPRLISTRVSAEHVCRHFERAPLAEHFMDRSRDYGLPTRRAISQFPDFGPIMDINYFTLATMTAPRTRPAHA
jgi:hypothetical protein